MSDTPPVLTPPVEPPVEPAPSGEPDAPEGRLMTQAELDALDQKLRRQAESKARKSVADELGISIEEAKALIEAKRSAEQAEMTEAERLQAEARAQIEQAQTAAAEARRETTRARLMSALQTGTDDAPGCRVDRLTVAVSLGLDVALTEGEEDPIAAAVAKVRELSPEWFTGSSGTPPDSQKPTVPPTPGTGRKLSERVPVPATGNDPESKWKAYQERRKAKSGLRSP